jgi:NAD(P)H-dependent FMN reductase
MAASKKIGVIIGSVRQPRIGDQVAAFAAATIKSQSSSTDYILHTIDLLEWDLPMFKGPEVPKAIKDPADYTHERTREWSAEISACDGFIFVPCEYNYGYPASLKNAIDHLCWEWQGKPVMFVAYGGYGGGRSVEQLKGVLGAFDMKFTEGDVTLGYPSFEWAGEKVFAGKDLGLLEDENVWSGHRDAIAKNFDELLGLTRAPVIAAK